VSCRTHPYGCCVSTARRVVELDCPECKGSGEVEVGKEPGCTCPYHVAGNAECLCLCAHVSDDCGFCSGTGRLHPPEPEWT
jgi:hypothetical protein